MNVSRREYYKPYSSRVVSPRDPYSRGEQHGNPAQRNRSHSCTGQESDAGDERHDGKNGRGTSPVAPTADTSVSNTRTAVYNYRSHPAFARNSLPDNRTSGGNAGEGIRKQMALFETHSHHDTEHLSAKFDDIKRKGSAFIRDLTRRKRGVGDRSLYETLRAKALNANQTKNSGFIDYARSPDDLLHKTIRESDDGIQTTMQWHNHSHLPTHKNDGNYRHLYKDNANYRYKGSSGYDTKDFTRQKEVKKPVDRRRSSSLGNIMEGTSDDIDDLPYVESPSRTCKEPISPDLVSRVMSTCLYNESFASSRGNAHLNEPKSSYKNNKFPLGVEFKSRYVDHVPLDISDKNESPSIVDEASFLTHLPLRNNNYNHEQILIHPNQVNSFSGNSKHVGSGSSYRDVVSSRFQNSFNRLSPYDTVLYDQSSARYTNSYAGIRAENITPDSEYIADFEPSVHSYVKADDIPKYLTSEIACNRHNVNSWLSKECTPQFSHNRLSMSDPDIMAHFSDETDDRMNDNPLHYRGHNFSVNKLIVDRHNNSESSKYNYDNNRRSSVQREYLPKNGYIAVNMTEKDQNDVIGGDKFLSVEYKNNVLMTRRGTSSASGSSCSGVCSDPPRKKNSDTNNKTSFSRSLQNLTERLGLRVTEKDKGKSINNKTIENAVFENEVTMGGFEYRVKPNCKQMSYKPSNVPSKHTNTPVQSVISKKVNNFENTERKYRNNSSTSKSEKLRRQRSASLENQSQHLNVSSSCIPNDALNEQKQYSRREKKIADVRRNERRALEERRKCSKKATADSWEVSNSEHGTRTEQLVYRTVLQPEILVSDEENNTVFRYCNQPSKNQHQIQSPRNHIGRDTVSRENPVVRPIRRKSTGLSNDIQQLPEDKKYTPAANIINFNREVRRKDAQMTSGAIESELEQSEDRSYINKSTSRRMSLPIVENVFKPISASPQFNVYNKNSGNEIGIPIIEYHQADKTDNNVGYKGHTVAQLETDVFSDGDNYVHNSHAPDSYSPSKFPTFDSFAREKVVKRTSSIYETAYENDKFDSSNSCVSSTDDFKQAHQLRTVSKQLLYGQIYHQAFIPVDTELDKCSDKCNRTRKHVLHSSDYDDSGKIMQPEASSRQIYSDVFNNTNKHDCFVFPNDNNLRRPSQSSSSSDHLKSNEISSLNNNHANLRYLPNVEYYNSNCSPDRRENLSETSQRNLPSVSAASVSVNRLDNSNANARICSVGIISAHVRSDSSDFTSEFENDHSNCSGNCTGNIHNYSRKRSNSLTVHFHQDCSLSDLDSSDTENIDVAITKNRKETSSPGKKNIMAPGINRKISSSDSPNDIPDSRHGRKKQYGHHQTNTSANREISSVSTIDSSSSSSNFIEKKDRLVSKRSSISKEKCAAHLENSKGMSNDKPKQKRGDDKSYSAKLTSLLTNSRGDKKASSPKKSSKFYVDDITKSEPQNLRSNPTSTNTKQNGNLSAFSPVLKKQKEDKRLPEFSTSSSTDERGHLSVPNTKKKHNGIRRVRKLSDYITPKWLSSCNHPSSSFTESESDGKHTGPMKKSESLGSLIADSRISFHSDGIDILNENDTSLLSSAVKDTSLKHIKKDANYQNKEENANSSESNNADLATESHLSKYSTSEFSRAAKKTGKLFSRITNKLNLSSKSQSDSSDDHVRCSDREPRSIPKSLPRESEHCSKSKTSQHSYEEKKVSSDINSANTSNKESRMKGPTADCKRNYQKSGTDNDGKTNLRVSEETCSKAHGPSKQRNDFTKTEAPIKQNECKSKVRSTSCDSYVDIEVVSAGSKRNKRKISIKPVKRLNSRRVTTATAKRINRHANKRRSIYRRGARRWRKLYKVNGHLYQAKRFNRRASCAFCQDRIWGLGRQGFKCTQCKLLVHKKCSKLQRTPCSNDHFDTSTDTVLSNDSVAGDRGSSSSQHKHRSSVTTVSGNNVSRTGSQQVSSASLAAAAEQHDINNAEVNEEAAVEMPPGEACTPTAAASSGQYNLEDFELLRVIGRGSYAKVLMVELKRTGRIYAMKVIKKTLVTDDEDIDWVQTEKHVFETASNHPFLVGLHSCFQTPSRLFFVIEFVRGGDLMFHMQRQRRLHEEHARFYAAEICLALNFLHEKGIIYRDLKLDNVLLDHEGHIKLTDYGMCKEGVRPGETTSTFCGTPNYIAPEILQGVEYTFSVDWWALGVLLYEMLAGKSPFDIVGASDNPDFNTEDFLFQVILERPIRIPRSLSVKAASILKGFLNKNPSDRLGCHPTTGFTEIITHHFFRTIDWELLEQRQVTPPHRPRLEGERDLANFPPEFTDEPIQLTPDQQRDIDNIDQSEFEGFEYVNPLLMSMEDCV